MTTPLRTVFDFVVDPCYFPVQKNKVMQGKFLGFGIRNSPFISIDNICNQAEPLADGSDSPTVPDSSEGIIKFATYSQTHLVKSLMESLSNTLSLSGSLPS